MRVYSLSRTGDDLTCQEELNQSYNKILRTRFEKLGVRVSKNPNGIYDLDDLLRVVMQMSLDRQFATSSVEKLEEEAKNMPGGGGGGADVPTPRWVMQKLADTNPVHVWHWSYNNLKYVAKTAVEAGMVRQGGMIALDSTNIPHYGKVLKNKMLKTRAKDGTTRFFSHVVAHTVDQGYDIPMAARRVTNRDKMHILVPRMLKRIDRAGARPELILLDRGFFSTSCINALKHDNRKFLMPAVKNKRIKKAILEYHNKKRAAASEFTIRNKDNEVAEFNLLIVKKENAKDSDDIIDRYLAFATNTPCLTEEKLIETLPETYRNRWIIETGFRVIKSIMPKTCTTKMHIRSILFHMALLLYGLWRLSKYRGILNGLLTGDEDIKMAMFVLLLLNVLKIRMWEKHHGNHYEY